MQLQMGELEDELKRLKEQLVAAEEERDRANDELREMKIVAQEANMRLSEALSSRKVEEVISELNTVKQSLSNSKLELEDKEKIVESLKLELEKAKQFELNQEERDEESLDWLNEELSNVKASNTRLADLVSESEKRIRELEGEAERGKQSESKMFDTVVSQTKELEQTKIELEESKLEIASLRDKLDHLGITSGHSSKDLSGYHMEEDFEGLKSELLLPKENLASAEEDEEVASLKANSPLEETDLLKNELKLALEAEERNKKAMDDLASALKEVATEANQAKEELSSTQVELEHLKEEAEQLKVLVRNTEDRYQKLLEEAKIEVERYENTVERLRLEAEESTLAWNDKEKCFVSCIKKAEEERTSTQQENIRLVESLKAAENMTRTSKEENHKLRDILKQALNEANVAKEAAAIARSENSHLKDSITEKDEALDFFTRENERLRIDDAAAHASIKELKRLLSTKLKTEDMDRGGRFKSPLSVVEERIEGKNRHRTAFSFDLHELKILNEHEDVFKEIVYEDPEKAEALKGSIFDNNVDTPKSEPRTPKPVSHHRRKSSFMDDGESTNSEDLGHLDETHSDDAENHGSQRKMRAMLRRFGDLLVKKKSSHKKEPSIE
ncbi:putative WEB family protein At1g65010, chloroplastic isoform X2 [Cornus florida]|nr:putative WEB family protein At1g65010, chloroplastic isoform X2 [Cornus florida]